MDRVFVGKQMELGTILMPIEHADGVKGERKCQTVTVNGILYQIDFRNGNYLGTDLKTLEVVVLDME